MFSMSFGNIRFSSTKVELLTSFLLKQKQLTEVLIFQFPTKLKN